MSSIHEEFMIDILVCLPVKSLIRFKSVCRPWNSLISSAQFAEWHLMKGKQQNYINQQRILITTCPPQSINYEALSDAGDDNNAVEDLNYPDPIRNNPFNVRIIGSCNGLMCLVDEYKNVVLWNPSTRNAKELPKHEISLKSDFFSGFGYDNHSKDYKVVLASCVNGYENQENVVEIYTLKANKWRTIQKINSISSLIKGPGIYWNRALHWLGSQATDHDKVHAIVTFDLTEEKFKQILPLPIQFEKNIFSLNLGLTGNYLSIFCERIGSHFEAFILNECGANQSAALTWTRQFSIPFYRVPGCSIKPLCLTKNGDVVFDFDGWELANYKHKDGTIKYIKIRNDWDLCDSETYVESLISPNPDENSYKGNQEEKN